MKYLIAQDWVNTSKNHAGMKYLCNQLQEKYPDQYKALIIQDFYNGFPSNPILRKVYVSIAKYHHRQSLNSLYEYLSKKLQNGDQVYLMEYMEKLTPQLSLAKNLKTTFPNITIKAMVHLVPGKLDKCFNSKEFESWLSPIDSIITMGTSLTSYFKNKGVHNDRLVTTFHYVDVDYYKKRNSIEHKNEVRVIAMGNQMRNVELLKTIVNKLPKVKFTICQGVDNMTHEFEGCNNVTLIPFIPEDKLKTLMDSSDISLNVMKDTVGSNVIVTSMAMGLAMICSDVGSIRDYCSENNCIFCKNDKADYFVAAIQRLLDDRNLLIDMRQNSVKRAQCFSIDRLSL